MGPLEFFSESLKRTPRVFWKPFMGDRIRLIAIETVKGAFGNVRSVAHASRLRVAASSLQQAQLWQKEEFANPGRLRQHAGRVRYPERLR